MAFLLLVWPCKQCIESHTRAFMEQYLNQALDRVFEPILVMSGEGRCLFYNQAVASFLGIPADSRTMATLQTA